MVTVKSLLLSMLVASALAYAGLFVVTWDADSVTDTYNVNITGNETTHYQAVYEQAAQISSDMEQIQDWLQDLTSGDVIGFVFAMPTNVAKILGLLTQIPTLIISVMTGTLAVFGIPAELLTIIGVMVITVVLLLIAGIWAQGRL